MYPRFLWFLLHWTLLPLCFFISWQLLCANSFMYGFFYDHTELGVFIETYAPENQYKAEYQHTNREERIRVFKETLLIVNGADGDIGDIEFVTTQGDSFKVYRAPEVQHLNLVVELVSDFKKAAIFSFVFFLFVFVLLFRLKPKRPKHKNVIIFYSLISLLSISILLLYGAENFFEYLHTLFFPDEDQWFFYYQDSLMTTITMAPKLFGYFAVLWGLVATIVYGCLFYVFNKIYDEVNNQTL